MSRYGHSPLAPEVRPGLASSLSTAVDFTDTMIRDVVTRGLDDQEIQQDLMGDRNQEPCLEEVIQFVESKESGKRLLDSHVVGAISRYNRSKKDEIKGALYRIWCGVNKLGDSGVKVV